MKLSVCSQTPRFLHHWRRPWSDPAGPGSSGADLIWILSRDQSDQNLKIIIIAFKEGAYITCKSTGRQFVIVYSTRVVVVVNHENKAGLTRLTVRCLAAQQRLLSVCSTSPLSGFRWGSWTRLNVWCSQQTCSPLWFTTSLRPPAERAVR